MPLTEKYNILCFVTDQNRADHLGCYGNPDVKTPHIDSLARNGVIFSESYVSNPVCMPNRASLFTGRYPKAHGLRENGNFLRPEEAVLPEILRTHGYETASFGKIHLQPFGLPKEACAEGPGRYESKAFWEGNNSLPLPYYGFESVYFVGGHGHYSFGQYKNDLLRERPGEYEKLFKENALTPPGGVRESWKAAIDERFHYNTAIADKTIEFLQTRKEGRPFFIWCSFPDPHHPYSPPRPYCDMYNPDAVLFEPVRRPGEFDDLPAFYRESFHGRRPVSGMSGDVSAVTDRDYREILAQTYGMISMVDANIGRIMEELRKKGLLEKTIVVFLSDHGELMGDHGLINKGPFLYRGLVRVPTIWRVPGAAAHGVTVSSPVSAVDFCPTMLDLAGIEGPPGIQGRSYKAVLSGGAGKTRDWTYIEYDESYLPDRLRQIRSAEWSLTFFTRSGEGMLFDLRKDPDERFNLWHDPAKKETKNALLVELLKQTAAADDPLPLKKCHA